MEFRVGIHVGDVVEESDGDLMGDGVNIAARLEGICDPGGIVLSGAAYEHARDRFKETFVDLGEKALRNIARSVHAYSVAWDRKAARSYETLSRLSLPACCGGRMIIVETFEGPRPSRPPPPSRIRIDTS
jgi:class 3 adenylate cyclase